MAGVALVLICSPMASAQPTWEYSPYVVHVWIGLADAPSLPGTLQDRIAVDIAERCWSVMGAAWSVQTRPCPSAFHYDVVHRLEAVTTEAIQAESDTLVKNDDKLYLVNIRDDSTAFQIGVREFDCRTRTWQPAVTRIVEQPDALVTAVFDAIVDAFAPLVRVEDARSREAEVRVRAGGLITRPRCPATIAKDDILLPIIRRNDRLGEPMENGIVVAPWTFMTVSGPKGSALECEVHSGMRSPLGGRTSTRTMKLGLRVKPREPSTLLRLETRGENPQALGGYAIYAKDPATEESDLVGTTDWRGAISLTRSDPALKLYYVRNGGRLLARLPMVTGLQSEMVVQLDDDDVRLQAEGFVKGLQNRVMDLVARRELYIMRFRRHLQNKEFAQAEALLSEFRGLQTQTDLRDLITKEERRLTSGDRRIQAKIDKLLTDTRQLVLKFLDPSTTSQLEQELVKAKSGGGTA
jgi:hypothetical protein